MTTHMTGRLRRGNFASKERLHPSNESFIAHVNTTMATRFRWAMEAKPLVAADVQTGWIFSLVR
jgi:hypothetical protein